MSYQGGKQRLGIHIYKVISAIENFLVPEKKLPYFEPFVGFCGVMKHFAQDEGRKCEATDLNKDIVLMWKELQKGWRPPLSCSKKMYEKEKRSKKHSATRGFIGVACSYGGIFFVGYRSKQRYKHKTVESAGMARRKILKIAGNIKTVKFLPSASYTTFHPEMKLIYCDPPYVENKYQQSKFFHFDSEQFWEVMREWSKKNIVIVSERVAPSDFKRIWYCDTLVTQNTKVNEQKEALFVHESLYELLSPEVKKNIAAM